MGDLQALIDRWGYPAIFLSMVLGNLGIPIPEDGVLMTAGSLAGRGRLSLPCVLIVGIVAAMTGDNLGYWNGRRFGQAAVASGVRWIRLSPERFSGIQRLVALHGSVGVFLGRFLPGLRCLVGPLAGSAGLPPLRFLLANTLATFCYVPFVVGVGYALGAGLGTVVERFHRWDEWAGHALLLLAAGGILIVFRRRHLRRTG